MIKILHKFTGKKFAVISFYTLNTIYEAEILRLLTSLIKFDLDFYIEGVPCFGNWKQVTDYKPRFIKRALNRVPNKPIVFIDADGEVVTYPILFENLDCDVAAFINHINNLLSGTVYLNNNETVRKLVDVWIKNVDRKSCLFEQKILQNSIFQCKLNLNFVKLPIAYCQIHNYKFQAEVPVILHWQASRRSKKIYTPLLEQESVKMIRCMEVELNQIWRKINER